MMLNLASFKSKPSKDKELGYLIRTVTIPSKNRNITLKCSVCKKKMRKDTLKRQLVSKTQNFDFQVTTVVRGFLKDKDSEPSLNEDLESKIVANRKLLDEKLAFGERISKAQSKTNIIEESLSKKHKKAFDLYQSRKLVSQLQGVYQI